MRNIKLFSNAPKWSRHYMKSQKSNFSKVESPLLTQHRKEYNKEETKLGEKRKNVILCKIKCWRYFHPTEMELICL